RNQPPEPAPEARPSSGETAETTKTEALPAPESALAAVRLLLQPKKRGTGVAALVGDVARQLGRGEEELLRALEGAGLNVPDDAKAKPTFGEHAGEIFWMNRNARGELWLNAKEAPKKKSRAKKAATSTDD